jgi:excisionase family DNA binding protein
MHTLDHIYDLRGLSAYCSLGVPTLRDHIRSGDLPCFKVKGKILVRRSEFDAWLERHRVNSQHEITGIVNDIMVSIKGKV